MRTASTCDPAGLADRADRCDRLDQGQSGASAAHREGYPVFDVGLGKAAITLGLEVSRLARNTSFYLAPLSDDSERSQEFSAPFAADERGNHGSPERQLSYQAPRKSSRATGPHLWIRPGSKSGRGLLGGCCSAVSNWKPSMATSCA